MEGRKRWRTKSKFVFVTGGVVSSIGKGITTACLGRLLKDRGYKVTLLKIDPYLNVDAGTMNPYQHGEVFVTDDGAETDLDLGHYERFVDINLTRLSNVTSGQVYGAVIAKERRGDYLGSTVQIIPHLTDEIKSRIHLLAKHDDAEITIVEIGGTVGDIEGQPFIEAARQFKTDVGPENVVYIHVTLIAHIGPKGEMKTKPTQHSVRELRSMGIQPDILICRSKLPLTPEMRYKISLFCDVPEEAVIEGLDTEYVYELPLIFERQGLADLVARKLGLKRNSPDHSEWEALVERMKNPTSKVRIAIVGKYTTLRDSYISVVEALKHGGYANSAEVEIKWVESEALEKEDPEKHLSEVDGILVPGGFGMRGIEGKIVAIRWARERKVPFLGLCLGLQCAVIEFARNVCGLKGANSSEFDPDTPHPVVDLLPEQRKIEDLGGTMRLGLYPCRIKARTKAREVYGQELVYERHRHRYEVNPRYHEVLERGGLVLSGLSPDGRLVEIVELPGHPFFIATQFHPEFKSRPNRAHPLFREFVKAAIERAKKPLLVAK
ncbi:MAG TPA: CTP synthase [Armatimonadetes bacterium]|nr:CTP synthase [Armatimonadota bacterium]